MKHLLTGLILTALTLSATAAELPDYLKKMAEKYENGMALINFNDDDMEDDNGNEFIVFTFGSRQDEREKREFSMRVTVQLSDKKTKTSGFAQMVTSPHRVPKNYAGQTDWEFRIPFGDMKKPKVSAYAVEFGFTQDSYFVPVVAEYEDTESAEEITKGKKPDLKIKQTKCTHWYIED